MQKSHTPTSLIYPPVISSSQENMPGPRTLTDLTSSDGKRGALPSSKKKADPTRYGDWERDGRCIDF